MKESDIEREIATERKEKAKQRERERRYIER